MFDCSTQGFAQEQSEDDYLRAIQEIADFRLDRAVEGYWSESTGFSMAPIQLEDAVKERDSDRVKQLEEEYSTIWKSVGPTFAEGYARRQRPINDRHLRNSRELRRLIGDAMKAAVYARGGGSGSLVLSGFAEAETEWILRQLWNATARSRRIRRLSRRGISEQSFAKQLRSSIFYYEGSRSIADYTRHYSKSLKLFGRAERLLTQKQQFVMRKELLDYFANKEE